MKTFKDLLQFLAQGNQPVVTFQGRVDDLESYAEAGMRGRLLRARISDDVVRITVDFEEFADHNRAFESANYFGKGSDRSATFTAREAGQYKPQDELYVMEADDIETFMAIEGGEGAALYGEFKASGVAGTYVQWLEAQLLAARGAGAATS